MDVVTSRLPPRQPLLRALVVAAALVVATLATSLLQQYARIPNASAVYLLAVVGVAVAFGTGSALLTVVGAFLLYDYLFTEPLYTFAVADPGVWLNLVLLLVIGLVVGQLAAAQRNRADAAERREREARVLFLVSRALATREETSAALSSIVDVIAHETGAVRAWITLATGGLERVAHDSDRARRPVQPATHSVLQRAPADQPAKWVRVHARRRSGSSRSERTDEAFRVNLEAGGRTLGGLWVLRPRDAPPLTREETRVLSGAADQIGQAIEQDRLAAEATSAELARRSDALKSALLDSVSHDLRTPLASIRAAAGSLMDREVHWSSEERRAAARSIDEEAERLNQLVTNLLDLSRVEAGGLRADLEAYPLDDLVDSILRRLGTRFGGRIVECDVAGNLPYVSVDAIFLDQILTNLADNAVKYTPAEALIRIHARPVEDEPRVRLIFEDNGPGVPDDAIPRLFDKFYRAPRGREGARRGTGIGLAVVRGLVETMGGRVSAGRSPLGGLAIAMDLPVAIEPAFVREAEPIGHA